MFDSWVFSTLLPSSDLQGHNSYDSSQSSTYQELSGYTWSISYADGSGASGVVGTDTVTIGGTTVQGQAVELAQQVSSSFVSDTSDGLVGLAFSSINTGMSSVIYAGSKSAPRPPQLTEILPSHQSSPNRNLHSLIMLNSPWTPRCLLLIFRKGQAVPTTLVLQTAAGTLVTSYSPQ